MIKRLLTARRELISYLFFGVLTTAVNYVVYFASTRWLNIHYVAANVMAWVVAVLFAYAVNRRYVFASDAAGDKAKLHELVLFVSARLFSLGAETLILWLFVDLIGLNDGYVKLFAGVLVVALNYFFSKYFIFNKRSNK